MAMTTMTTTRWKEDCFQLNSFTLLLRNNSISLHTPGENLQLFTYMEVTSRIYKVNLRIKIPMAIANN